MTNTRPNRPVLIVEDDPDGQEVMAGLLGLSGFAVRIAGSAEIALQMLTETEFAAAVIDVALPGMDGLALLQQMRDSPTVANLPCIILTAYHSSQVKKEALEKGCNVFLTKPVVEAHLLYEIDQLVTAM